MLVPAVANYTSFFYPLGNTPAINLTRTIPRQAGHADILLLGSGNLRNILFTTYADTSNCHLDFTCCDYDIGIISRNIFLLSMMLDHDDADTSILWDIYYHMYLRDATLSKVASHAQKLLATSDCLDTWASSLYGSAIKFYDSTTLAEVRATWRLYVDSADPSRHKPAVSAFKAAVDRTREYGKKATGGGLLGAFSSAAPILPESMDSDILGEFEHYWKTGVTSRDVPVDQRVNPLFASTLSPHKILYYATDPIAGFHLAMAYTPLADASPLRPGTSHPGAFMSVLASRVQFNAWVTATRQRLAERTIIIRYIVADALDFSHTLQAAQSTTCLTANLYRRRFDPIPLVLEGNAPRSFDAIDTSNICDHLGLLNVLIAAAPLMKDRPWASLSTELLLQRSNSHLSTFEDHVCGDLNTVFLLLGISPMEYWSNSTATSRFGEVVSGGMPGVCKSSPLRLTWVKHAHLSDQPLKPIYVRPECLANIFFQVYKNMFRLEVLQDIFKEMKIDPLQVVNSMSETSHHQTALVTLIKHAQSNISTDWDGFFNVLTETIYQDRSVLIGNNHIRELESHWSIQGLYQANWLTEELKDSTRPPISVVNLAVPRDKFMALYKTEDAQLSPSTFQVSIRSSGGPRLDRWENIFAVLHISLGVLRTTETGPNASLKVHQHNGGWDSSDDLVVSFYAPTLALLVEPETAVISLQLRPTTPSLKNHPELGLRMSVFETRLDDRERVFVTRYFPGQTGHPDLCALSKKKLPTPVSSTREPTVTANLDDTSGHIVSLTGRVDMTSTGNKKLLTDRVSMHSRQGSPFVVEIVFESQPPVVFKLHFPIPVDKSNAKTRIARTSGYVEIIVPIASPLTTGILSQLLYPTVIPSGLSSPPVALGIPCIRLDGLPIVDLSKNKNKKEDGKSALGWLNTLASLQYSPKELKIRERSAQDKLGLGRNLRVNFKETIFTLFMLASGLQGGQAGVFTMDTPHDKATHMMIFARCIRLDGPNSSAILDAAVLPVDTELVQRNTRLQSFLVLVHTVVEACQVNVDADELVLWKQIMPALAERCRTWEHKPDECEYRKAGCAPTSIKPKEAFLCSCGRGKGLHNFVAVPDWDTAAQFSTRVAISPTFGVSIVEDGVGELSGMTKEARLRGSSRTGNNADGPRCRKCGAANAKGGGELKKCSGCRSVSYCSVDCQRADWRTHKNECKETQRT